MRLVPIVAGLVLCSASCIAQELTGANCELQVPPASAGESESHGALLKIFPRGSDIGPQYSGCQSMWVEGADGWSLVARTELVGGDPVRIVVPDGSYASCEYRQGRLVSGVEAECADARFLLVRSLPAGCIAKLRDSVAKGGLSAAAPAGCEGE